MPSSEDAVDEEAFAAPDAAAAPAYPEWFGGQDKNIEFYDPDELEAMLPTEPDYCTVLGDPEDQKQDPAWIEACEKLYPASAEARTAALRACIAEKADVYSGPKVILMNKSWTTAEILEHPAILQHLQQTAKPLWEETLRLCEGTEPPEWVVRVWMMRLIERALDHFTISSK